MAPPSLYSCKTGHTGFSEIYADVMEARAEVPIMISPLPLASRHLTVSVISPDVSTAPTMKFRSVSYARSDNVLSWQVEGVDITLW